MKIGELAALTGCPVETVRYYERAGLLPPALRDRSNNYRHYDQGHLERLRFLRRCRALDMTQEEIRALIAARTDPDASCASINELIDRHLMHVRARVAELTALEAQLIELLDQCQAVQATRDCGILRELDQPGSDDGRAPGDASSHLAGCHGGRLAGESSVHPHDKPDQ